LALSYQKKACLTHNKNYKKQKKEDKSTNLIQCYYFLSSLYSDLKQYDNAIAVSDKAISIFDQYDKNEISKLAGAEQLSWQISERARIFKKLFKYDEAIADYERYLKLVNFAFTNQIGSKRHTDALKSIIAIYGQKGDSVNEFKYLKLNYEIAYEYQSNNSLLLSNVNIELGLYFANQNRYLKALEFLNEGLKIIDKSLNVKDISYELKESYLFNKEIALSGKLSASQLIKPDEVKQKEIVSKLIQINDQRKLIDKSVGPYESLISYYEKIENYDEAEKIRDQAYDLLKKQIAEAKKTNHWMLEYFYKDERRLKTSEAYSHLEFGNFNKAIKIVDGLKKYETKDTGASEVYRKVNLLNIYGRGYAGLGKTKKAINYYLKALDILNVSYEKDYDQETSILNNLALSYGEIGETYLSIKYMKEVVEREEKNKNQNPLYLVKTYNNFSITSFYHDPETALKYALKAYQIFQSSDPQHKKSNEFVNNINFLGGYYKKIGIETKDEAKKIENFKKAEKYYSEVIDFVNDNYEKNIFPYYLFLINYSDLASLLHNDFDTCIKYQEATVKQIEKVNEKSPELISNYDMLWACYSQKGDKEVSFDYLFKEMLILLNEFDKNNIELNFSINNLIKKNENAVIAFANSVMIYSHKNPDILLKYKLNFSDLIFALQQVLKTNELSVNISQAISREMAKNENISSDIKIYTSLLKKREKLLKIESIDKEEIKNINLEIKKINDEIDRYKEKILTNYPEFKKNFVNQIASIKATQENLKEDEALIQYSVGRIGSFASVITSDDYGIVRFKDSGRQGIIEKINKIRSSLQLSNNKPKLFAKKESEELFNTIFSRFDDKIKEKKKIIIVPDGPLYGLPFELLFDKENQKWLLEKYAITISPSVYSFIGLNKNVEFNTSNSFIGFGNPKIRDTKLADNSKLKNTMELEFSELFTRGGDVNLKYLKLFPELPETEIELKSIASKFDKNSKLYLGEDFNEDTINSIDFKKYKVISFASHALVVGEIDGLSEPAIVLSLPKKATVDNDGLLTTSEIIKLDLNSDLVILSACNTASSSGKTNSEALSGLATSFFYSGARSLLVTHWSIISETSVDLVSDTFDYLGETNGDISLALAKAKIKMMENEKTSHPIYWAPYTLVGRSQINKL